jgi:predicted RNA-binding protein with PUA domain
MNTETEQQTEAAPVVDSTVLVARLRVGIQWRAELLTDGGTELMQDYGATEALMRQAANRIEELEKVIAQAVSEGECYCSDYVADRSACAHCNAMAVMVSATVKVSHRDLWAGGERSE